MSWYHTKNMFNVWFDVGFALIIGVTVLWLIFKTRREDKLGIDDDHIIKGIERELDLDNIEHFELESIVSLNDSKVTSVIVNIGHQEIAIEVDNITGKIIHKEKLARQ